MDVLRTAVSALAAFDPETADTSRAGDPAQGHPADLAGADDRRRARSASATARRRSRRTRASSHAANFLWMLKGEKPSRTPPRS